MLFRQCEGLSNFIDRYDDDGQVDGVASLVRNDHRTGYTLLRSVRRLFPIQDQSIRHLDHEGLHVSGSRSGRVSYDDFKAEASCRSWHTGDETSLRIQL